MRAIVGVATVRAFADDVAAVTTTVQALESVPRTLAFMRRAFRTRPSTSQNKGRSSDTAPSRLAAASARRGGGPPIAVERGATEAVSSLGVVIGPRAASSPSVSHSSGYSKSGRIQCPLRTSLRSAGQRLRQPRRFASQPSHEPPCGAPLFATPRRDSTPPVGRHCHWRRMPSGTRSYTRLGRPRCCGHMAGGSGPSHCSDACGRAGGA